MSTSLLIPMPGNDALAASLIQLLPAELGRIEIRQFPDGESYVRLVTDPARRSVALLSTLNDPNHKLLPLIFAASTARELGASRVGLIAPYLAYMRQDRRFQPGEAVTSRTIAAMLSRAFDWIVTVDPHLHRYVSLGEIYSVPARVVHAAPVISEWIVRNVRDAVLIGPDSESEQWVSAVAKDARVPFTVLEKIRHGDRNVKISVKDLSALAGRAPVLIDDIISTGRTMIAAVQRLREHGASPPFCLGVHGLFADDSDRLLKAAGATVVTCNTVPHASNQIRIDELLAIEIRFFEDAAYRSLT
jgi:ribose-phosphate pyrophosphokinase